MDNRSSQVFGRILGGFLLTAFLSLTGCDSSVSGVDAGSNLQNGADSLDPERGREKFNTYDFSQGNLDETRQPFDLALTGPGFFILNNRSRSVYFRRPASFILDADGYLILGNENARLAGIKLFDSRDPYANPVPDSSFLDSINPVDLTDIRLPYRDPIPAKATTEVRLAWNLDSDSPGYGSISYSQPFYHPGRGEDLAIGICDHRGNGLGMQSGDVLTFSVVINSISMAGQFKIVAGTTLADITGALTHFLRTDSVGAGAGTTASLITAPESSDMAGSITIYGNTSPIQNFEITSNGPISGRLIARNFLTPKGIPAGTEKFAVVMGGFLAPAVAADRLLDLYDSNGSGLGLETGDEITITGRVGLDLIQSPILQFVAGDPGTTFQEMLDLIQNAFHLPKFDGTPQNQLSVGMNAAGTDDNIPDGSLVVRGQPGENFGIRDLSFRAMDWNNSAPSPNLFNSNLNITLLRGATDDQQRTIFAPIYDGLGKEHSIFLSFIPTAIPNHWLWTASVVDGLMAGKISGGNLIFGMDGSVSELNFGDGGSRLEFDPQNGADTLRIKLMVGGQGDFTGLTQFRSPTTANFISQNGFASGTFQEAVIYNDGSVVASYSNGVNRILYKLALADFPNPKGLSQIGANSFLESKLSGPASVLFAGYGKMGTITSGFLEPRGGLKL